MRFKCILLQHLQRQLLLWMPTRLLRRWTHGIWLLRMYAPNSFFHQRLSISYIPHLLFHFNLKKNCVLIYPPPTCAGRRRRLRVWQVVISIIGSIIGALLILCLCLACIRNCLLRRRTRDPIVQQGDPAYGHPQQAAYPQQGVPMYETNNQKVPGPAGVV